MNHRPMTRRVGLLLAAATLLLATGCKASPRSDFHYFTSGNGTIRCASALSAIAEYADRDDDGHYPAGSVTQANKDLYCSNEDTVSPAWSNMKAKTRLIYYVNSSQVAICSNGPTVTATGSDHQALSATSGRCGSNRKYYAAGTHDAKTSGGADHFEFTYSPEITLP